MPTEWILNNIFNRFQLNQKKNVGATSKNIRECQPKNIKEWEEYYFKNVRSKEHIEKLGKILKERVKAIAVSEVNNITEKECISYIIDVVIRRTYEGYVNEIEMIKNILEKELNMKIEQAPDEIDRLYGVDFIIEISNYKIGLQIKPTDIGIIQQVLAKYIEIQKNQHKKFTKEFGGKVFFVFSIKKGRFEKVIQNQEVINQIKEEIIRLSNL